MSAMYYLTNINKKRTYYIGTANNARNIILDILLNTTAIDDKVILFSEDSHCEDIYLDENNFIEIDSSYCGETSMTRENFWNLFEKMQSQITNSNDMVKEIVYVKNRRQL